MSSEEKEQQIRNVYYAIYDKIDRNGNNILEKGEFHKYLNAIFAIDVQEFIDNPNKIDEPLPEGNITATYSNYVFRGIDFNSKDYVNFESIYPTVRKLKEKDKLTIAKIGFRVLDIDHSKTVELSEVKQSVGILGCTVNEKKFLKVVGDHASKSGNSLTFPQFYELITGEELEDKSIDPYDGLPVEKRRSSSCCYII